MALWSASRYPKFGLALRRDHFRILGGGAGCVSSKRCEGDGGMWNIALAKNVEESSGQLPCFTNKVQNGAPYIFGGGS